MTSNQTLRTALVAALVSTALASCNVSNNSSGSSGGNASADASGISLDSKAEKQIRDAIAQAPQHGLKPELFLKGGETGQALVQAGLNYASALANGYSDPNKLFEVYTIPRNKTDVRPGFQQAIQKGNVGEWFNTLPPQTDEYRALSKAFMRYAKLASQAQQQGGAEQNASGTAASGKTDVADPQVIATLKAGGYLPDDQQQTAGTDGANQNASSATTPAPNYSRQQITAAVKQFQADSGVKSDGVLGKDTRAALSTGPAVRARQLAVAMERLRWMQRDPAKTRIDVNTAASLLDYWRDGQHVDHRKVINGQPDKPTPQLQAPIFQLVAKPEWNIPEGIAAKELATKSAGWLSANGYSQENGKWVQKSGEKNSLGLVKFDMRDDQAIYLHDTPAKAVFGLDERHRSHGCVRVENAVQFATALAQQENVIDKFSAAMQKDDPTFIKLPNEIPVRLLYQTAFWDGSRIQFRDDVYGWDENIAKALQLAAGPPQKIRQPQSSDDIGP